MQFIVTKFSEPSKLASNLLISFFPTAAVIARKYLNGFDLFYNCNTLQIEFAWTSKLIVVKNDIYKSWDYTKVDYAQQEIQSYAYNDLGFSQPSYEACYQNNNIFLNATDMIQFDHKTQTMVAFSNFPQYEPCIIIISGLDINSNTVKLFNLISLYGNVAKIQFLPHQRGTAIVQMFDQMSAECCIRYLNNVQIGPYSRMKVNWSNQPYEFYSGSPYRLSDNSMSFKDFTESKNQRFLIPRPSYWIQPPSNVVRFYNTPSHMNEELLMEILRNHNVTPSELRFFPVDEGSRLTRGLIKFLTIEEAIDAIVACNNIEIKSLTNSTFFMKLCFSYVLFNR